MEMNTTNSLNHEDQGNFSQPLESVPDTDLNGMNIWLRLMWDSLFIIIILVAIIGNLMVMWVISGQKVVFNILR